MRVAFRTDAGRQMGNGHLMRCLALAQAMQASAEAILFVVEGETIAHCEAREDWVGDIIRLPADLTMGEQADWLNRFCAQRAIDVLVLDGYQFTPQFREEIAAAALLKVWFDDTNSHGELFADVVINGAGNADKLGYGQTADGALHCLGEQYRVLRREFSVTKPLPIAEREQLALTLGGSDPQHLTLAILQALEAQGAKMSVCVITGSSYGHLPALHRFLETTLLNIQHQHNCHTMAEIYNQSRLAISAAGGSQFELAAMATPAVLLVVADNQKNATAQAVEQGWCVSFDCTSSVDADQIVSKALSLLQQPSTIEGMAACAAQVGDPHGATRVADAIVRRWQESRA